MEKVLIGRVRHYFPKVGVAVVMLEGNLKIGDRISLEGKHTNYGQVVSSMQKEHKNIQQAARGDDIGLKVEYRVHEGDLVHKIGA